MTLGGTLVVASTRFPLLRPSRLAKTTSERILDAGRKANACRVFSGTSRGSQIDPYPHSGNPVSQDLGDDTTRRRFRAINPVMPLRTKSATAAFPSESYT